jgi:3-hydroxybutyryl-CoA dehydrogenase
MDAGGLEVMLAICDALFPDLSRDKAAVPALRNRVHAGKLGLKSGEGWYRYTPEEVTATRQRLDRALMAWEGTFDDPTS